MSEYIVNLTDENHIRLMAECDGIHEEIVRCRDCKYLIAHGTGCSYWDYCDIESIDGFCAWGERRPE